MDTSQHAVYVVIEIQAIQDMDEFGRYAKGYRPVIEAFGGEVVATTMRPEPLEGDYRPLAVAIQRWPSEAAFQNAYASKEYAPWKDLRHRVATTSLLVVHETHQDVPPPV
jgi:uncharacterized protein (DUF1330 family)